jgi:hypothetical protein
MCIIEPMDLHGVDLKLLVSLRVLLTQRHVTRSAEKLSLTQPAMSASLARSRTLANRDLGLVVGYLPGHRKKVSCYLVRMSADTLSLKILSTGGIAGSTDEPVDA